MYSASVDLSKFSFPVEERMISVEPGPESSIIHDPYKPPRHTDRFKAIVRPDTNELISVVRNTYKMVKNQDLIEEFSQELDRLGHQYIIEPSHTFVRNNRMRMQFRFPELKVSDGQSDIDLSVYLNNSYDMSEGVRSIWGAIRGICSNGMIFGKVLGKFYRRHTSRFDIQAFRKSFEKTMEALPEVQRRIIILMEYPMTDELLGALEKELGTTFTWKAQVAEAGNQWDGYNRATHLISHDIKPEYRERYQRGVAKVFAL